jgi:hypothetical protein
MNKEKATEQILIRITKADKDKIEKICKKEFRTITNFVRRLIDAELNKKETQPLNTEGY